MADAEAPSIIAPRLVLASAAIATEGAATRAVAGSRSAAEIIGSVGAQAAAARAIALPAIGPRRARRALGEKRPDRNKVASTRRAQGTLALGNELASSSRKSNVFLAPATAALRQRNPVRAVAAR
jgi:hypothetical protein